MSGPILDVGAGEAVTIAAGETRETGTVRNAGTVSNAGTLSAGGLALASASADIDAATASLDRNRLLASLAADIDATSGGLARTRDLASASADIDAATATLVNGRLLIGTAADIDATAGTLERGRSLASASADIDAGTAALDRSRTLASSSVDIDATVGTLERSRDLLGASADIDAGVAALERIRTIRGTAADIDGANGALFVLIVPESQEPVGTIIEILDGTPTGWKQTPPTVKHYWDDAQSERGPGAGQPPVVYAWQPTTETHERFSIDGTHTDDSATVEVLIFSLDPDEPVRYANDARNILQLYFDDNKDLTNFQTIEVSGTNDYREQKAARQTNHYVTGLEIDLGSLQQAGDLAGRISK